MSIHHDQGTDGTDPEALMKNADAALYAAKGDGKNAFRIYSA